MGQERNKYLLKNTIIFALGNVGTKIISFFMVPLYTNILTTEEYGTTDLIYTVAIVLTPILTFNISESIMRFSLDKGARHNKIMSVGLASILFSILVGLILLPALMFVPSLYGYRYIIYFYIISTGISQIFLAFLRGKELLLNYAVGNIIYSFSIAVFNICFLVYFKMGITGYFTAYICANMVTAIYAFVAGKVFNSVQHFEIDMDLSRSMVKYSIVLIPTSFMWWIMNSSDRIMVTSMVGVAANGVYAISYKIPTLLSTVTNVFSQAWSYSAIRENGEEDIENYTNNVYKQLSATVMLAAGGMLLLIKPFLSYYVSSSYFVAWRYTPYLILGYIFNALGTFLSTPYSVNKNSKGFFFSGTVGALVNVGLNFAFIRVMGIAGAALATALSYFTVFLFRAYDTKKYVHVHVFEKIQISGMAILLGMAFTLFIDNAFLCETVLSIEFLALLFCFRSYTLSIIGIIMKKIRKR